MKQLEIVSKRIATMAKEQVEGREIFYNYDTTELSNIPQAVSFSMFGSDGKTLSGSYSQGGGFVLNGNGITDIQDLNIVQTAFATMLAIINSEIQEVNNEEGEEESLRNHEKMKGELSEGHSG